MGTFPTWVFFYILAFALLVFSWILIGLYGLILFLQEAL